MMRQMTITGRFFSLFFHNFILLLLGFILLVLSQGRETTLSEVSPAAHFYDSTEAITLLGNGPKPVIKQIISSNFMGFITVYHFT